MTTTAATLAAPAPSPGSALAGRSFVNLPFDYLIIGGLLSLLLVPVITFNPGATRRISAEYLPALLLLTSAAHFAASTVRLYTKPGARDELRFLTMVFPLVAIGVLLLALLQPERIGSQLQALYLTWSPFHYSAQAYGLAVMYCYRSGCRLGEREKTALWWIAMLPFARAFLGGLNSGLGWFVSRESIMSLPVVPGALEMVTRGLAVLTFVLPIAFIARRFVRKEAPVPLMVLSLLTANGIWWIALDYVDAFVWATIFHGLQYLAIAAIFHVRDRCTDPANRRSPLFHTAWFYGVSLTLGYALFYCWPYAFVVMGFGMAESMLLVIAVINVHHFVVDRYIWRLGRDRNYRHVAAPQQAPVPTPV
jgi:hypothetical protein